MTDRRRSPPGHRSAQLQGPFVIGLAVLLVAVGISQAGVRRSSELGVLREAGLTTPYLERAIPTLSVPAVGGFTAPAQSVSESSVRVTSPPEQSNPLSISVTALNTTGPAPLNVTFTETVENGPTAHHLNLTWSFGDGAFFAENKSVSVGVPVAIPAIYHVYQANGSYVALITADDGVDPTASASVPISVHVRLSVAVLLTPASVTAGRPISLTESATSGHPPYSYFWGFLPPGCVQSAAAASQATCTESSPGVYTAIAVVEDNSTAFAAAAVPFTVNAKMSITATGSGWYRCINGTGAFQANLTGSARQGTPPYSYSWTLGDGSQNLAGPNATHNYTTAGAYNVSLNVTDASGSYANRSLVVASGFGSCAPPGSSQGNPVPAWVIGGLMLLIVIIAVLVVILIRRRPPKASEPPTGEPTAPPAKVNPPGGNLPRGTRQ